MKRNIGKIMKRKLQTMLFITLLVLSGVSYASQFQIKDTYGLVLVNTGDSFVSATKGQALKAGDQVYILDRAVVVLAEDKGCHLKIRHNALITLNSTALCDFQQSQIKLMGTAYASAIGLIDETQIDAASADVSSQQGALGSVIVEEEPIAITDDDKNIPSSDGGEQAIASLASKLAVPATVVGAVAFSALAGGGGIFGDANGSGVNNPDTETASTDDDTGNGTTPVTDIDDDTTPVTDVVDAEPGSGTTPEPNPVSPA